MFSIPALGKEACIIAWRIHGIVKAQYHSYCCMQRKLSPDFRLFYLRANLTSTDRLFIVQSSSCTNFP